MLAQPQPVSSKRQTKEFVQTSLRPNHPLSNINVAEGDIRHSTSNYAASSGSSLDTSPPPVVGRMEHITSVSVTFGGASISPSNERIACVQRQSDRSKQGDKKRAWWVPPELVRGFQWQRPLQLVSLKFTEIGHGTPILRCSVCTPCEAYVAPFPERSRQPPLQTRSP